MSTTRHAERLSTNKRCTPSNW